MHEHGLHSQTCFKKSQNHLKQGISSIIMQHSALWVIARTVWDLGLRDDCPLRPLRQRRVAWISRCRNALRHRHTVRVGLFLCRADRIQPASSGRCERRYTSARTAKRGGGGWASREVQQRQISQGRHSCRDERQDRHSSARRQHRSCCRCRRRGHPGSHRAPLYQGRPAPWGLADRTRRRHRHCHLSTPSVRRHLWNRSASRTGSSGSCCPAVPAPYRDRAGSTAMHAHQGPG